MICAGGSALPSTRPPVPTCDRSLVCAFFRRAPPWIELSSALIPPPLGVPPPNLDSAALGAAFFAPGAGEPGLLLLPDPPPAPPKSMLASAPRAVRESCRSSSSDESESCSMSRGSSSQSSETGGGERIWDMGREKALDGGGGAAGAGGAGGGAGAAGGSEAAAGGEKGPEAGVGDVTDDAELVELAVAGCGRKKGLKPPLPPPAAGAAVGFRKGLCWLLPPVG